VAWNAISIVPASGSTATSSQPSSTAAGGGVARPSITSQNGPCLVMGGKSVTPPLQALTGI